MATDWSDIHIDKGEVFNNFTDNLDTLKARYITLTDDIEAIPICYRFTGSVAINAGSSGILDIPLDTYFSAGTIPLIFAMIKGDYAGPEAYELQCYGYKSSGSVVKFFNVVSDGQGTSTAADFTSWDQSNDIRFIIRNLSSQNQTFTVVGQACAIGAYSKLKDMDTDPGDFLSSSIDYPTNMEYIRLGGAGLNTAMEELTTFTATNIEDCDSSSASLGTGAETSYEESYTSLTAAGSTPGEDLISGFAGNVNGQGYPMATVQNKYKYIRTIAAVPTWAAPVISDASLTGDVKVYIKNCNGTTKTIIGSQIGLKRRDD